MTISILVMNMNDKVGHVDIITKDPMVFIDQQDLITTNAQIIITILIGLAAILTHILRYSILLLIILTSTPMVIMVPMGQISTNPIMAIVLISTTVLIPTLIPTLIIMFQMEIILTTHDQMPILMVE